MTHDDATGEYSVTNLSFDGGFFSADRPTLTSVTRQSPSEASTSSDTLTFNWTFDKPVIRVSADDFTVTGGSTASVTNVVARSATSYDLTVSGGDLASFAGTVGLDFSSSANFVGVDGSPRFDEYPVSRDTFTKVLETTPPMLTAFARKTPADATTGADTLVFDITFNENVTGVDAADFVVTGTTATGVLGGSGAAYTLTLSGGDLADLEGGVGLDLKTGHGITDAAGNALPDGEPGTDETYTLANDQVPPVVQSIALQGSAAGDAASITYLVTFDEAANNITTDDFELTTTGTASGTIASVSAASGVSVTVTVNALLGAGTARLDLKADTDIVDAAGNGNGTNGNVAASTSDDAHTVARTPTISIASITVDEGDSGTTDATVTVTLTPASTELVTIELGMSNAGRSDDFVGTIVYPEFQPGDTSKTFTVIINGDEVVESNEDVQIDFISTVNGSPAIGDIGKITITNDDEAVVTIDDVSANEDDGDITITATLDAAVQGGFTADAATADGTATAGTDYTALSAQTLNFSGAAGETQTFTISPTADMLIEPNETLTVSLSNLQNSPNDAAIDITDTALVTITSDDNAALTIEDVSGNEDDGAITVSVVLDKAVVGGFTVDVSTVDGTATVADSDYTAITNQTLTFAGTAGETQTFTVTPTADAAAEANETITVSLSNIVGANAASVAITDTATVTITNDDTPMLSIDDVSVAEGDGGPVITTFTVSLNPPATGQVMVDYGTASGTAISDVDFAAESGTLIFAAGETSKTVSINVFGDPTVEVDEIGFINLSNPTGGAALGDAQGQFTIPNDDIVSIRIINIAANEDGGDITVAVRLERPVQGGFSVDVATADGTATVADNDYTAVSGQTLTFVGEFFETQTFTITPTADTIVEANEDLTVSLSNLQNAANPGAMPITNTGTVRINNDDGTAITIEDVSGAEDNGAITLTAMLSNAVSGGLTVDVSTVDGTATVADNDYSALASQTLTFVGTMNEAQTFTVAPIVDSTPETNETLTVSLSNVTGPNAASVTITDTATVTITDDDIVSFSVADVTVTETNADQTATFTISLNRASGIATTVDYAITPGTASARSDYVTVSGTLNFSAGETSKTVDVTIVGDQVVESNETATFTLSNASAGTILADATATLTINNDDNDSTAPTVAITSTAMDPVSGQFTATVTFSESVTGFVQGDITVGNGSPSNFAGSGTTYTVDITPAADGAVTLDVAAGVAQDSAGNDNIAAPQFSITNDQTGPTVAITSGAPDPVSGAFTATVTFSEGVTGFEVGDITATNSAASNFATTSASVYTALITPAADGAVTLDVAAAVAQDSAGNDNQAAPQFSITNDQTGPTVSISSRAIDPVSGAFTATVTFSEAVTGFVQGDITVGNGSPSNFAGSGTTYTVDITPAADGAVTLDVAAGVAQDSAGNDNIAAPQFSITNDQTGPTVSVSGTTGGAVADSFTINVTFSETVTDFTVRGISVSNGSASNFTGSGASYSALIAPAGDGTVTVTIPENVAQDAASNGNLASAPVSQSVDSTPPSVSVFANGLDANGTFSVSVDFTENVVGFSPAGIFVTNGSLSNFSAVSGASYMATITPSGDGVVTIQVPDNVAQDNAGNWNSSSATVSVTVDLTPPTASLSASTSGTVTGTFSMSVSFSESVVGFSAGGFAVGNGTVSDFEAGSDTSFSVTITPAGDGPVTVSVPAGATTDRAGNDNTASETVTVQADVTAPSVTVSPSADDVETGPFEVSISFSEDVTGLTLGGINVSGGTASEFTANSGPSYSATITPSGDGTITISVAAGVAQDAAGNANTASEPVSIEVDQTPPTVSLTPEASEVSGPFSLTVSFSEPVEGFDAVALSVSNGTISDFSGSGTSFSATITPETVGEITISIADGAARDAAGNPLVGDSVSVTASGGDVEVELELTATMGNAGDANSTFTLNNPGTTPIRFTASADQPWVDVSPSSGEIGSLGDLEFQVTLNDQIDQLPAGTYVATVTVQVDDATTAKTGAVNAAKGNAASSQNTQQLILASVPITVEVKERFGSFELVIISSNGPSAPNAAFTYASDISEIDGLSIAAGSGESVTRIDRLLNGPYEITQALPDGWTLSAASCAGDEQGNTQVDPVTGKITLDLSPTESVSCQIENSRNDDAIRLATQRAIRNFMARRGDRLLETAPDLSTRFSERQSQEGGSFSANGAALRTQMDFRTSLAGFRNRAASNAVGDNADLTKPVLDGWDLWVSAEYSRVEDERVGSGIDAKFFAAQVGLDYEVKENLLLGALVQYDWMSEDDEELAEGVGAVAGAQVEGDGFMVGPYAVWQVTDTLILDAMGLWGTSDNTVNPLGYYEDDFETTRFLLRANATGQFTRGPWTVRPQLTWSHYEDEQDAYIDSLGIDIPSQTVTIGRLRAGPELVWTHRSEAGLQVELGGGIRANWDYDGPGLLDQAGRLSNGGSDLRADGDLLLGLRFTNGASLRAKVGIDGIGQGDFNARSGRLELTFPFGGKGGGSGTSLASSNLTALDSLIGEDGLGQKAWNTIGLGNDTLASRGPDLLEQRVRAGG